MNWATLTERLNAKAKRDLSNILTGLPSIDSAGPSDSKLIASTNSDNLNTKS